MTPFAPFPVLAGDPAALAEQPAGTTWSLPGDGRVLRTVLPSGLRVITEHLPTMRSVSIGAWVDVGSRDETPSLAGATHFLEHMVFKGTRRRSPAEISQALESRGGDLNAFTTKEYTCYHAQALDTDVQVAVDVVCDLVTSALVRGADVDLERPVVLEEIAMHADDPNDAVHELVHEALWGNGRLGRPVIGTVGSVQGLSRDQLLRWYRSRYQAPRVVLAAAGNLDHDEVVRIAQQAFASARGAGESTQSHPAATPPAPVRDSVRGVRARGTTLVSARDTEQVTLALGFPAVGRAHPSRYAYSVLSVILGGGMSSRLFQEVREERGLAYHVSAFQSRYAETGMLGIQAGTSPERLGEVQGVLSDVLADVADNGVTQDEMARARGQMRGSFVLGLEDTTSRMSRLAMAELVHGRLESIDDVLAHIDEVSAEEVHGVAASVLGRRPARAAVGRLDSLDEA